jgi:guanylate kinase
MSMAPMAEAPKPGAGHDAAGAGGPAREPGPAARGSTPPGGFILVVTGPSGAGKGTLVSRLLEQRPDCVFSVSATTRPRRNNENHGREYVFLDDAEFMARVDRGWFLEWANVHGKLYGTPVGQVDEQIRAGRVVVLDVDVQGGASVRRARPRAVTVFVYPPSLEALRARLESRGTDSAEVIAERLRNAPGELAEAVHYDYIIMNDDLERATAALLAIHDSELARVRGAGLSS